MKKGFYIPIKVKCSAVGCKNEISNDPKDEVTGTMHWPSQLITHYHWIVVDINGDMLPVCCSEHADITKLVLQ